MKAMKICSILLILALLALSVTPLAARNRPYPNVFDSPISHPWQDDNQAEPLNPQARLVINVGGVFIGFDMPSFLSPVGTKSEPASTNPNDQSQYRSISKNDNRGIRRIVTTKGH
jgi:hypothetical protein